jgi:hypothetical protein
MRPQPNVRRRYDRTPIEQALNPLALPPEFENTGLALLTDQLEDFGNSEVLEISTERYGHGYERLPDASDAQTATA